jgi:hypothetical protein
MWLWLYRILNDKQCLENAVYAQMKRDEKKLEVDDDEMMEQCAGIADWLVDEMLSELAKEIK